MTRASLLLAAVLLLALPAAGAEARRTVPYGFYGAMWDGTGIPSAADADAQWGRMAASGVESARTVFSWAQAEPEAGQPTDFRAMDRVVRSAALRRIRLLPAVGYTPEWAKEEPGLDGSPPADPRAYAAFLTRLVGRYGPSGTFWAQNPGVSRRPVREWQIWNEPHLRTFWNYSNYRRDDPRWVRAYGTLLRASYRAIKRADSRATVVLAGLTNDAWTYLKALYNEGGARRYFDVAAMQTYTATPERLLKAVQIFRRVLTANGDRRKPIWLTEMSWPAARGRMQPESHQRSLVTTDRGMAERLTKAYALLARHRRARSVGLGRAYWYTWASTYRGGDSIFRFAGLLKYDGRRFTARPALRAYRRSAARHQGCAKTSSGTCRR